MSFIGGSGSTTVHTGAGSVLIQSGNGGGTFSVASSAAAHDTITVGGVADMITIQAGHSGGLDVIKGFRLGIDQLVLAGYASGVATAALQAQSSDGAGGTLLHLPDGMNSRLCRNRPSDNVCVLLGVTAGQKSCRPNHQQATPLAKPLALTGLSR